MSEAVVKEDAMAQYPHMRVLFCDTCRTIEELPDWEGHPDDDPYLPAVAGRHGPSHTGPGLFRLPIGLWLMEDSKKSIIEQVKGGGKGLAQFDPSFYDTQNTFKEDAAKCYSLHLRPVGACPDWQSKRKELLPDTKAERKDAGVSLRPTGPKVWLCSYCVVRNFYERKVNEQRGL
jgi:hypothetical protein